MQTSRKKPGVAFWATVVVVVVLAYPLSFGPACWITSRTDFGASSLPIVYWPLIRAMSRSERIADALDWYAQFGAAGGWHWRLNPFASPQGEGTVSIKYRLTWSLPPPPP